MMQKRGQGTIEYLVIIAIVVVIALVVVGLLLQIMNQGSGLPETTAKTAWKSTEPWAIVDWSRTGEVLTVVLKNNSYETLDFVELTVNSNGDSNDDGTSNVSPAGLVTKTIDNLGACTSGTRYSLPKEYIQIDFNTPNIAGKTQKGVADIVGSCS